MSSSCCIWSTSSPALQHASHKNLSDFNQLCVIYAIFLPFLSPLGFSCFSGRTVSISPPVSQDEEPNMTAGPNLVLLQEAGQQQKNLRTALQSSALLRALLWTWLRKIQGENVAVLMFCWSLLGTRAPPSPTIHQISMLPVKRSFQCWCFI